ncbi:MAG: tyrosine-type recombinase/integrase, partial [Actinobacteria bacterium]|nr:tyrosine-type recombinase/integrase [Actinomycetota bacterium]
VTRRLWTLRGSNTDAEALIFGGQHGKPVDVTNLYNRVFKPAARRAGVPWATFHTLRHTCATLLFRSGKNPKQVQAWLGHHAASFTMDTYVHLLPDDVGDVPSTFSELAMPA